MILTCRTTHTSTFAATDMDAGCDKSVIQPLKKNNKCGVCKDAELPMDGNCDWEGFPCEFGKDECGVCYADPFNKPEKIWGQYRGAPRGSDTDLHLAMRNQSGICDYKGDPCTPTTLANGDQDWPEVSVCGLCVPRVENRKALTVKNQGICDCMDSGKTIHVIAG